MSLPRGNGRSRIGQDAPDISKEKVEELMYAGLASNIMYKGTLYAIGCRMASIHKCAHTFCPKCYAYNAGDAEVCCMDPCLVEDMCPVGKLMDDAAVKARQRSINAYRKERDAGVAWAKPKLLPRDVTSQETALALEWYDYCVWMKMHPDTRKRENHLMMLAPYKPDILLPPCPVALALKEDGTEMSYTDAVEYNRPKRPSRGRKRKAKEDDAAGAGEPRPSTSWAQTVQRTLAVAPAQLRHETFDDKYISDAGDLSFSDEELDVSVHDDDPFNERTVVQHDIPRFPMRPQPVPYHKQLQPEFVLQPALIHNSKSEFDLRREVDENVMICKPLAELQTDRGGLETRLLRFPSVFLSSLNERLREARELMISAGESSVWPTTSAVLTFDKAVAANFYNPMPECASALTHEGLKRSKGFQEHLAVTCLTNVEDLTKIEEIACHMLNNMATAMVAQKAAVIAFSHLDHICDGAIAMDFLRGSAEAMSNTRDLALELMAWTIFRRRWTMTWAREQRKPKGRETKTVIENCTRDYTYSDLLTWEPKR